MSKKCRKHGDAPVTGHKHGCRSFVRFLFVTAGLVGAVLALVYWLGRPGTQE